MICLGDEPSRPQIQRLSRLLLLYYYLLWLLLFNIFWRSFDLLFVFICFIFFLVFVHFFFVWVAKDVISSTWNRVDAAMSLPNGAGCGVFRRCQRLGSYGFNGRVPVDGGCLYWNLSIVEVCEGSLFVCVFGNLSNIAAISIHVSPRRQVVLHEVVGNFKLLT